MNLSQATTGVVILAAGRSVRMGRPKLLLPWGKSTILAHLIEQWRNAGANQAAIVCDGRDSLLRASLEDISFPAQNVIHNPEPDRGMFSSIVCASAWQGWDLQTTRWAIALGDQPHIRLETLAGLLAFAARHPDQVCQPASAARRAHPVVLPKAVFLGLAKTNASTLKEFLAEQNVALWRCDDLGLDLDIDTPADYARALSLAGLSGNSTGRITTQ